MCHCLTVQQQASFLCTVLPNENMKDEEEVQRVLNSLCLCLWNDCLPNRTKLKVVCSKAMLFNVLFSYVHTQYFENVMLLLFCCCSYTLSFHTFFFLVYSFVSFSYFYSLAFRFGNHYVLISIVH